MSYILEKLRLLKPTLKKQFGIEEFALFGSVARDEFGKSSDVDIAVIKAEYRSGFDLIRAKNFLQNELNKSVDIGSFHSMKTFIKNEIQKDMIYV